MLTPNLINHKFKSFQWKSKRYKGVDYKNVLRPFTFFFWALNNFYISMKHLDLISKYIKRKLKKNGKLYFPIPCDYPITKKPSETRMGKGKGSIDKWVIPIKRGSSFLYLKCINKNNALIAMYQLLQKIPFKAKISYTKHFLTELTANKIILINNNTFSNQLFFRLKLKFI